MIIKAMKSLGQVAWYAALLAGPPMLLTTVTAVPAAQACTGASGPDCGCGCSSRCTGYHGCGNIVSSEGCQTCVIDGTGCSEPSCT